MSEAKSAFFSRELTGKEFRQVAQAARPEDLPLPVLDLLGRLEVEFNRLEIAKALTRWDAQAARIRKKLAREPLHSGSAQKSMSFGPRSGWRTI